MWYHFRQNNSGGVFDYDHSAGISEEVWVEADSSSEANDRAQALGIYFDGCENGRDCACCGDRWYSAWSADGKEAPPAANEPPHPVYGPWIHHGYGTYVHPKSAPFYGAHFVK